LESFHGDALIVCLKENGGSLDEDVLFRKYQDYINLPMALNKIPTLAKSIPILSPLSQIYELFQFDTTKLRTLLSEKEKVGEVEINRDGSTSRISLKGK
jgi:hypothetical protein